MAATGFTPISLYYSTTASAVPTSGNLANGELGLNIADMKLYAKNSSGTVTLLASSSGATGTVSSVSVASANGFSGTVANSTTTPAITLSTSISGIIYGTGGSLTAVTIGSGISFASGTLSATGSGGTVTSVAVSGGTTGLTTSGGPITGSGTITLAGTLGVANGGTGLTTLTANNVILGNGTSAPSFVAPGTSGNVLTSDGTTWTSAAGGGGGAQGFVTQYQGASAAPTMNSFSIALI
jgi:hypothetical protein